MSRTYLQKTRDVVLLGNKEQIGVNQVNIFDLLIVKIVHQSLNSFSFEVINLDLSQFSFIHLHIQKHGAKNITLACQDNFVALKSFAVAYDFHVKEFFSSKDHTSKGLLRWS